MFLSLGKWCCALGLLCFLVKPIDHVFVSSIPKSGTLMVVKLLHLLHDGTIDFMNDVPTDQNLQKNNWGFVSHTPYSAEVHSCLKRNKYKIIFVYRDPRDVVVSYGYFIQKQCPAHKDMFGNLCDLELSPLFTHLINELPHWYMPYLEWLDHEDICCVRFEDLVGSAGGGDRFMQAQVIVKVAKFLGIKLKNSEIDRCCTQLYGGTLTFRNGQIGSWKHELTLTQRQAFNTVAGRLLIDLGYERSREW